MSNEEECQYCGESFQTESKLGAHLSVAHSQEELSRIDQRRVAQKSKDRTNQLFQRRAVTAVGIVLGGVVLILFMFSVQASFSSGEVEPNSNPGDVRTATDSGNIFLGGDFMELGIRGDGGFGAEAPDAFFGSAREGGDIGLYADIDGFYNNTRDLRYEYFLPGTPEERWSVGYNDSNTASNGQTVGESIPTTVTEASTADRAAAEVNSTYKGTLQIEQRYSFDPTQRYFRTVVTFTNVGDDPIDSVRYQRSFDPDNGQDLGCDFETNNTVVSQQPTNDTALVKAAVLDSDACRGTVIEGDTFNDDIPIFYYSEDERVRVSTGASSGSLTPSPVVYAPEDYNSPQPAGTNLEQDTYIAMTFEEPSLDPGESATFRFFTGLTNDIDTTIGNIGDETSGPTISVQGADDVTISNTTVQGGE